MKYSIVKEAIELMSKLEDETIIYDDKGLSISAVLCDLNEINPLKIDYNTKITTSKNEYLEEFKDINTRFTSHAEYKLLQEWKDSGMELDNYVIIVTIPPCKKCLQVIREFKIKKVYYLYHNEVDHKHKFEHYKKIRLENSYIEHLDLNNYSKEKDIEKVRQKKNIAIKKIRNYLWWLNK